MTIFQNPIEAEGGDFVISEIQIREAKPDDAEGMVRVLNPIIEAGSFTALDKPVTVESQRRFITDFPKRGLFLTAVCGEDQCLVGMQNVAPFGDDSTSAFDHVGVIATYVDLSQRRQGIGKQLFQATFIMAKEKGYRKFFTYIRADNPAALAAYTSQLSHHQHGPPACAHRR